MPCVSGALVLASNLPPASVLCFSIVSKLNGGIASEADSYRNETSELAMGCRVILSTKIPVILNSLLGSTMGQGWIVSVENSGACFILRSTVAFPNEVLFLRNSGSWFCSYVWLLVSFCCWAIEEPIPLLYAKITTSNNPMVVNIHGICLKFSMYDFLTTEM